MDRISAFFATQQENVTKKKPLIILLSGNPPGSKESLVSASLYFSRLGFHTVEIDRRKSSRVLDKKEKFLPVFSDLVADLLRLMDYLASSSSIKSLKSESMDSPPVQGRQNSRLHWMTGYSPLFWHVVSPPLTSFLKIETGYPHFLA